MKRHLAIIDFTLGALKRRSSRAVSLSVGVALVTMLYASGLLLTDALRSEVGATIDETPDLTLQRLVAGRPGLIDAGAIESVQTDPGVRSIRPRVWGFLFVAALEANVVVIGRPEIEDPEGGPAQAIVGHGLAERLGLRDGDRLSLLGSAGPVALAVREVRPMSSALHDSDALYVSEPAARSLLGVADGQAVDIAIDLVRTEEAAAVGGRLTERVPGSRVIDRRAIARAYELTFDGRGGMMNALLLPCLAALLLLAWDRVSGLGTDERREIGTLKSIGWLTSDVLWSRLYESLILALFGTALGLGAAYVFVFWLHAPGLSGVIFGWSVLHADLALIPSTGIGNLLTLAAIVVIPFVAAGLVPAWRAAATDADQGRR